MDSRTCAAKGCHSQFEPTDDRQIYCKRACGNRERVRRCKAKRRNGGGNGGPGGGGPGGGGLFETIVPNDPQAIYVPDTCYRTPQIPQVARKPSTPVRITDIRSPHDAVVA